LIVILFLVVSTVGYAASIPALVKVPDGLSSEVRERLTLRRQELTRQLKSFLADAELFNSLAAEKQTDAEYAALEARRNQYISLVKAFNQEVADSGAASVNDERELIRQRLQEPNRLCSAVLASLKVKEPPLPYKTFGQLQPGDVLLVAPLEKSSRLLRLGDRLTSWEWGAPASHTVLFLKEVKGRRLFLDNQLGEGPRIITEEEFLKKYAERLPSSSVVERREPGMGVAQPLSKEEGDKLWAAAAALAAGDTKFGLYGDEKMVCSEASRWALVKTGQDIPETSSPFKKMLGIYYGPANFYADQEHFIISPLGPKE